MAVLLLYKDLLIINVVVVDHLNYIFVVKIVWQNKFKDFFFRKFLLNQTCLQHEPVFKLIYNRLFVMTNVWLSPLALLAHHHVVNFEFQFK